MEFCTTIGRPSTRATRRRNTENREEADTTEHKREAKESIEDNIEARMQPLAETERKHRRGVETGEEGSTQQKSNNYSLRIRAII